MSDVVLPVPGDGLEVVDKSLVKELWRLVYRLNYMCFGIQNLLLGQPPPLLPQVLQIFTPRMKTPHRRYGEQELLKGWTYRVGPVCMTRSVTRRFVQTRPTLRVLVDTTVFAPLSDCDTFPNRLDTPSVCVQGSCTLTITAWFHLTSELLRLEEGVIQHTFAGIKFNTIALLMMDIHQSFSPLHC